MSALAVVDELTQESAETVLRRAGMRATLPRRAILDAVRSRDRHWSVEDVRHELVTRHIDLPRSSVNNVLGNLAATGLVRRVETLPGATRFERNVAEHDHFWCVTCRSATDVARARIGAVTLPGPASALAVTYFGQCATCAS